jgi:hypothetical protein
MLANYINIGFNVLEFVGVSVAVWYIRKLRSALAGELRRQHVIRTPAAALYGSLDTLIKAHTKIPLASRIQIYEDGRARALEILNEIDRTTESLVMGDGQALRERARQAEPGVAELF